MVTVQQGESTGSVVDSLSQQHVIGSSLAFRISDVFHGTPTVLPGSYALHQNLTFAEVRALLAAGPNIYPVDVRPGFTLSEVAQQVDSCPATPPAASRRRRRAAPCTPSFSPPGSNNLEGMLGTGDYLILPGESDPTIVTDMVHRFDHDATGRRPQHGLGGRAGHDALPGDHGRLDRGEGGLHPVNMPKVARVIYNRLAQGTPLQMDSTVLYAHRPGRGAGHLTGPQDPVALQHLPQHGPDADPICMPSQRRAGRRRASAGRAPGCTSCWSRRTASWPSPTPTPSSWPTSSWPSPVASPEPRAEAAAAPAVTTTMDGAGPTPARDVSSSGSSAARSRTRCRRCCTTRPSPRSGSAATWRSLAFEVAPGRGRGRPRRDAAGRHQRAVGHDAAQGRRGGPGRRVHRRGAPARCRELRRQPGRASCSAPTPTARGSWRRWPGARPSTPAGKRCLVDRRRRRGPGRGAGPGRGRGRRGGRREPDARAGRRRRPPWPAPAGSVVPAGATARWPRPSARPTWWSTPPRWAWPGASTGGAHRLAGRARPARMPARWRPTSSTCPRPTRLAGRSGGRGRPTVDGLGMLVHQAAAQLVLWTGAEAPVEAMWRRPRRRRLADVADPGRA